MAENGVLKAAPGRLGGDWDSLTSQTPRRLLRWRVADRFPGHLAAGWCGHAEQVATEHYWTTTKEHFESALETEDDEEPVHQKRCSTRLHMARVTAITALPRRESRKKWAIQDSNL